MLRLGLRNATVAGLVVALSSAASSAPVVPDGGNCSVNATAWKIPNNSRTTASQSPVGVPDTRTDFTMAADGCAVVQVTAYANTHSDAELFLYFVLDGVVGPNQMLSEVSETSDLVTTTHILQNVTAGAHRLSLRVATNGAQAFIIPLNITVRYRK